MPDDDDSKTESPTERRLEQLREEGQVPKSRDVTYFVVLIGVLVALSLTLPPAFMQLVQFMAWAFNASSQIQVESFSTILQYNSYATQVLAVVILPTLLLLLILGLASQFLQTGFLLSTKAIQPKLSRISLLQGFKRLFSLKALVEFGKALIKMVVVGVMLWWVLQQHLSDLVGLTTLDLSDLILLTAALVFRLVLGVVIVMAIFAALDFLYNRFEFQRDNRMSFKDLRDELKETQGDPFIKARQRQLRQERARSRMMANVPKADVVITNPTHFAVALRYDTAQEPAPRVLAKGVDLMAERIRRLAHEHNIPLVENPPLARQLYKDVEIDEVIPLALYEAVSKVIAYVLNLKGRRRVV